VRTIKFKLRNGSQPVAQYPHFMTAYAMDDDPEGSPELFAELRELVGGRIDGGLAIEQAVAALLVTAGLCQFS
jgi:hypothetical protein